MWQYLTERERARGISLPASSNGLAAQAAAPEARGCELNQLHVYHRGTEHTMALFSQGLLVAG